jgi:ribosomal protein L29
MSIRLSSLQRPLAASAALVLIAAAPARAATQEELEAKVNALATQVAELRSELATLRTQAAAPRAAAPAAAAGPANPISVGGAEGEADGGAKVSWFGYGEFTYSRPENDGAATTADLARFVLGAGYRFDDKTRFVSELELEHAVASASDAGEIEVEQAYIERRFNDRAFGDIGLFLMPIGLLNENHEPTRYYGVFRNFVETAIIPTTWREGGFQVQGNTDGGLRWNLGLSTGFNLSKWDATSTEGLEAPLASIHQELALASAGDLAAFAAVNYTGIPGLRLGASLFSGDAAQGQPRFHDNRVTLWEGHARWNPGNWDLSALYSQVHISNTAPINTTLVGNPALIPAEAFGWYLEAAYRAPLRNEKMLAPFARYERLNTGSEYAFIGAGLTPAPLEDTEVLTTGINFELARGVVLKFDYLQFLHDSRGDRLELGAGYQF